MADMMGGIPAPMKAPNSLQCSHKLHLRLEVRQQKKFPSTLLGIQLLALLQMVHIYRMQLVLQQPKSNHRRDQVQHKIQSKLANCWLYSEALSKFRESRTKAAVIKFGFFEQFQCQLLARNILLQVKNRLVCKLEVLFHQLFLVQIPPFYHLQISPDVPEVQDNQIDQKRCKTPK